LEAAQQLPVDAVQPGDAGVGSEAQEDVEVLLVGADGVGAATLVEGLPVQVFLDRLVQGDRLRRRAAH
jgi:hypothetical protein